MPNIEREKLIEELRKIRLCDSDGVWNLEAIADFILEDRKMIVEPIRAYKEFKVKDNGYWTRGLRWTEACDETLKNAGVE